MPTHSLDDIKKRVDELALQISVPANLLPSYGQLTEEGHPCIEVDELGFMLYILSERGDTYEKKITGEIDDLLYWIFTRVTFAMACDYEMNNSISDKDARRIIFSKQEELLGKLNDKWRQMKNTEHQSILKTHPFNDLADHHT
jgi:hypothetical protein